MRFFLLLILLTPSLAYAFDGVFTMSGVTQKKYYPLNESRSVLYYTLKAKQRIEHKNKHILKLSYHKQTAREVLEYLDGSLSFADMKIDFASAYYYRGVFYMEGVKGKANADSFTSKEIAFDPLNHTIVARHVIFRTPRGFKVKKNYAKSTLPTR